MGTRETQQALERIVAAWQDAGLDPEPLAPVVEALARPAAIRQEAAAIRDAAGDHVKVVGRKVAEGMSLAEGIAELHAAEAAYERGPGGVLPADTRLTRLANSATNAMLGIAVNALQERGDQLVAAVDEARERLAAEVDKIAPVLEGIEDAASAIEVGGKAPAAWRRLTELERHRTALSRCWLALRGFDIIARDEAPPRELTNGMNCGILVRSANDRALAAAAV
jgi:hypothetical protein